MKTTIVITYVALSAWFGWTFFYADKRSPTDKALRELIDIFAKQGKSKFGLSTYGSEGGTREKINTLNIHFTHYGKMTLEEARAFIVDITHDFLEELDKNKKYEKYLHEKSTRINTLNISVALENEETNHQTGLYFIVADKGTVRYVIYDPDDPKRLQTKTFLRESFEEAEQIVAKQRAEDANNTSSI